MSSKYAGIKLTNGAATTVAFSRLGFLSIWWEPTEQRVRIVRRGNQPDWFKEDICSQDAALAYCDSVVALHAWTPSEIVAEKRCFDYAQRNEAL